MSLTNSPIWFGSGATGGGFYDYEINDSLRFDRASISYLNRTASSPTLGTKATWSFWIKKSDVTTDTSTSYRTVFYAGTPNSDGFRIGFARYSGNGHSIIITQDNGSSSSYMFLRTNAFYRDVTGWYHFVISYDSTDATAADRVKVYTNGELASFNTSPNVNPPLNHIPTFQVSGKTLKVGDGFGGAYNEAIDAYLADVYFIDGQALDGTSFAETKDGVWIPKDASGLTFGTNGFYLNFSNNSTATNLGLDSSGNSNNFSVNNIATTDQMIDTPTNNFCTLNSIDRYPTTNYLREGSLLMNATGVNSWVGNARSTYQVESGKWYWEVCMVGTGGFFRFGIRPAGVTLTVSSGTSGNGHEYYPYVNQSINVGGNATYGADGSGVSQGTIWGVALDMDNGTLTMYRNNVTMGQMSSGLTGQQSPTVSSYNGNVGFNFGQDSSFAGTKTAQGNTDANGNGDFYYTPPSGFLSLCSANLPEPVVGPLGDSLSDENFNTVLYTGNDSTQSITGVGFQPDLVWIKQRSVPDRAHRLNDSVRGVNKQLYSNLTNAEGTATNELTSFDSDGFSLGSANGVNGSDTYVGWNWKAGGTAVSNTDGTITSQVSAGEYMSICTWTGNGTSGATIGHGLGKVPSMLIVKRRTPANGWAVYHEAIGTGSEVYLNYPQGKTNSNFWITSPTTSVFSVSGSDYVNLLNNTYVGYAFANLDGACKVGSYIGNSSADGTFVYTGFRPAWVLVKNSSVANSWRMWDSERPGYNLTNLYLTPDNAVNEGAINIDVDFTSNGFKLRGSNPSINGSGNTMIYLAFAKNPFKYANAR
jgi:hypothetical protein